METEYIEKQAVMDKFAEVVASSNNSDFARVPSWNRAVGIVEGFPPADVRPVVRGRWKEWWPGDCALILTGEEMLWMCSECTAKFSAKSSFCPNCGADMTGGDAE